MFKNKFLYLLIFFGSLSIFFFIYEAVSYAQQATSNCVTTRIGSPTGNPSPPANCTQNSTNPGTPPSDTKPGEFGFPLKAGVIAVSSINTEMATYGGDYENCMEGSCHAEHAGLDIMVKPEYQHTEVVAVANGQVTVDGGDASTCSGIDWGCRVEILHDDGKMTSAYVHIDPSVSVNTVVKEGDIIGYVHRWPASYGAGMDHLHFELKNDQGYNVNPRNYYPVLNQFPPADDYTPTVREHTARRGYPWVDDGKEFGETFKNHPPCPAPNNNDTACWAH